MKHVRDTAHNLAVTLATTEGLEDSAAHYIIKEFANRQEYRFNEYMYFTEFAKNTYNTLRPKITKH